MLLDGLSRLNSKTVNILAQNVVFILEEPKLCWRTADRRPDDHILAQ